MNIKTLCYSSYAYFLPASFIKTVWPTLSKVLFPLERLRSKEPAGPIPTKVGSSIMKEKVNQSFLKQQIQIYFDVGYLVNKVDTIVPFRLDMRNGYRCKQNLQCIFGLANMVPLDNLQLLKIILN